MKYSIVSWDHREQPDEDELNAAMNEVFDGKHVPVATYWETGDDSYMLVFTSEPASDRLIDSFVREWIED